MKIVRALFSVVLSVVLLFQSVTASASSMQSEKRRGYSPSSPSVSDIIDNTVDTNEESKKEFSVLYEVSSNRTAYTKEFVLSNGLHMAVSYPDQVHFKKDGKWTDIDNTLNLVDGRYTNTENSYRAFLPEKITGEEYVTLEKDGNEISFRLLSSSKGDGEAQRIEASSSKIVEKECPYETDGKFHPEKLPEKLTSRLSYDGVFKGTDLLYDLTPYGLKESLVFDSLENIAEVYTFELNAGSLIPRVKEDNSIEFFSPGNEGEPTLIIPAPFLMDDQEEISTDIKVLFEQASDEETYILSYTLPNGWLSSSDRAWPVVLDPAIQTEQVRTNIRDKAVYQTYNASDTLGVLEVGKNPGFGLCRSFVKFVNLPAITSSDVVVKAELYLCYATNSYTGDPNGQTAHPVEVHKVLNTWETPTLVWATQPSIDWAVDDETNQLNNWFYRFEITDIARDWYSGDNTGFALTLPQSVENNSSISSYRLQFWSADYSKWQTIQKPTAVIYFRNNNGLEGYWDYDRCDAGRAGTGNLNTFTGNLVFLHNDPGFSGNRMPVAITHVYNLNDVITPSDGNNSNDSGGNTFHMGYGWRTNFNQLLYQWSVTDANTTIPLGTHYVWEDSDGTDHYFASDNGTYKDEDGLGLTLTTNGSGNTKYCITDKKGNKTYFDTLGRLTKLSNNQATVSNITVTYNGNTKEIDTVTDGVGRRYVFTYSNSLLSKISYYGTGTTILTYQNYYYTNQNLTSIKDKDEKIVYYTYDSNRLLTSAKDVDGYKLNYTYNTVSASYQPYRVLSVEETDVSTGTTVLGGKKTYSYSHNETVVTDHNNNKLFLQFNDFGNLICTKDDEGKAVFSQYAFNTDTEKDSNSDATKKGNQLRAESDLQYTVVNLMKGHTMENALSYWSSVNSASITRNSSNAFAEKYSLKVAAGTANGGIRSVSYSVPAHSTQTFSCYVLPSSANVYLKAVSGSTTFTSETLQSGSAWKRLQVSYKNDTSSAKSVQFSVLVSGTGTFYVDSAQLETSVTANRYNLIEDGDFRYGNSFTGSSGSVETLSESAAPQMDGKALKLTGDYAAERAYSQTIAVTGAIGDYYTVAGWAKGTSLPLYENRKFAIIGTFHYSDNTWSDPFIASFNPDSNEWQYSATGMIAEKAYTEVKVTLAYNYNANTAYFDGIQLYKDGYGYKYEYDSDNHVISILSSSKEKDEYEYTNNDLTREILHTGSELTYTYDNYHNVLTATTDEGLVYHFTYDAYGNNTNVSITDGAISMATSATYTSDGNSLASTTDSKGNVTTYQYNANTNLLEWVKYPNDTDGTRTEYNLDSMYRLSSVNKVTDTGHDLGTSYNYDSKDRLSSISSETTIYGFSYGAFSLRSAINIGSRNLATYSYSNDRNHYLTGIAYGNSDSVSYTRDSKGRITLETYEDNETVRYIYDNDGSLASTTDSASGTTVSVGYDYIGRVQSIRKTNNDIDYLRTNSYEDNSTRLNRVSTLVNGASTESTFTYDNDKRITVFSEGMGYRYYTYDGFDRLASYTTKHKANSNTSETTVQTTIYSFVSPGSTATTNQVSSLRQQGADYDDTFTYIYDGNENVLSVSDGTYTTTYQYDSANQLIRENDQLGGFTHTWTYDDGGNILNRKEYSYLTGSLTGITPIASVTYVYGDSSWGDLLTSYDGNTITYDTIGNPLSDGTWTYTWHHGRELASMSDGSSTWNYTYDASGYRTKRTDGTTCYTYAYADGRLQYMEVNGTPYYFTYAPDGSPIGMKAGSTQYYYETNLQGDVVGILSSAGNKVVKYTYDAWGKILSVTGSEASTIGIYNPIRYRGYVYDQETDVYYLGSRYYKPDVGRFINADTFISTGQGFTGNNKFVYCGNNPIISSDDSGYFWHIVIGAAIGGLIGGISSIVGQVASGRDINWAEVGISTAAGVISGGINAACPGMGVIATGLVNGALGAATHAATELVNGRTPTVEGTFAAGITSGVLSAGAKAVGNLLSTSKGTVNNIGRSSNNLGRTINNDVLNAPRVGSALKTDPYHAFPNIVDNYAGDAVKFPIKNGQLYQLSGSLNGIEGRYEWIIQGGNTTHRLFVPGGIINGIPIK